MNKTQILEALQNLQNIVENNLEEEVDITALPEWDDLQQEYDHIFMKVHEIDFNLKDYGIKASGLICYDGGCWCLDGVMRATRTSKMSKMASLWCDYIDSEYDKFPNCCYSILADRIDDHPEIDALEKRRKALVKRMDEFDKKYDCDIRGTL